MSYATILLHLDASPRVEATTAFAVDLARQQGGHLIGLAASGVPDALPGTAGDHADLDALPVDASRRRDDVSLRANRFRAQASAAGLSSFEAIVRGGDEAQAVLELGRCADLVVLGQADPDLAQARAAAARVEHIVYHAAGPVLVVPYAGRPAAPPGHVLLAWSEDRCAARAASAALPLLRAAARVTVMHCERPGNGPGAPLEGVVRWLARHHVNAHAVLERSPVAAGEALLSRAADLGVDLIAMGAWNHSRLGEAMLGGVTRTLLESMTVPVLMAR